MDNYTAEILAITTINKQWEIIDEAVYYDYYYVDAATEEEALMLHDFGKSEFADSKMQYTNDLHSIEEYK